MRAGLSHTICHVSRVMCHVSCVLCHVSPVTYFFLFKKGKKSGQQKFDKVVELVGGGSIINGAYPV